MKKLLIFALVIVLILGGFGVGVLISEGGNDNATSSVKKTDKDDRNDDEKNFYDYDSYNEYNYDYDDDDYDYTKKPVTTTSTEPSTKKPSSGSSSNTSSTPKDYGEKIIVDGAKYNLNIGDTIDLVIPDIDDYDYFDANWYGTGAVATIGNGEECNVRARSEGESKVGVYFAGKKNGQLVKLHYEVTFTVIDPSPTTSRDYGNSGGSGSSSGSSGGSGSYYPYITTTNGNCSFCHNRGTIDCGACTGGWITTHFMDVTERKQCDRRGCVGGRIDCAHCN